MHAESALAFLTLVRVEGLGFRDFGLAIEERIFLDGSTNFHSLSAQCW